MAKCDLFPHYFMTNQQIKDLEVVLNVMFGSLGFLKCLTRGPKEHLCK